MTFIGEMVGIFLTFRFVSWSSFKSVHSTCDSNYLQVSVIKGSWNPKIFFLRRLHICTGCISMKTTSLSMLIIMEKVFCSLVHHWRHSFHCGSLRSSLDPFSFSFDRVCGLHGKCRTILAEVLQTFHALLHHLTFPLKC